MEKARKREMIYRIIAGLILVPAAIYIVFFAHRVVFYLVIQAIILLAVREFIPLVSREGNFIRKPLMWAGAVSFPAALFCGSFVAFIASFFMLIFAIFILKMFSSDPVERVFEDVSESLFSVVFVPFLLSFMFMIRDIDPKWLFFLLFVIWASDTFAYFTGVAIGKRKLIPRVSPGKTVEGLIGGSLGALIMAFIINYYLLHINNLLMFMIAIDLIAAGIVGDLAESMLKRSATVKDSGRLIPGHGGVLDRFDSLMFAAPVLYFYLYFIIGG